jgi:uncharacterized protein
MHAQSESNDRVERYLLRFRMALGSTPDSEKNEIVSDIRCHISERIAESGITAEQALGQTLDALGSPESLAQVYRAEGLRNRAAAGFSPWLLLRATFAWAIAGIEGFLALLVVFTGYVSAISFLACAVSKPIFPDLVGMWVDPPLFTFGMHPGSHTPRELLGYWIIPVSLVAAVSLFVLTTKFGRWLLRRFSGKLKPVHPGKLAQTLSLLLVFCLTMRAQAPSITGKWSGELDAGSTKLHVGLDIMRGSDDALKATMSVVEQGIAGLQIDSIALTGGHVSFKLARIGGSYEGTFKDARIEGTWSQSGHEMPLTFEQGGTAIKVPVRPQNPTAPFPYNAEEISVSSGSITLAGTFTSPKSGGPFPALLLITGSGPEDRDETVFGHKPFLILSDYLTRAGFAVLRLDDRGTGKSSGDFKASGMDEFTNDALAAVSWLKDRKDVNRNQIGLIGHSEGGAVAPLAAIRSQDVAFIVLMAGPGIPVDKLMYRQSADIMRAAGAPEDAVAANAALMKRLFAILREEPDRAKATERIDQLAAENKAKTPELAAMVQSQGRSMILPEFRSLLTYDAAEVLRKVKCPVLAIDGSKDLQVSAGENLAGIAAGLAAGENPDFAIQELPGLNHLFQTTKTGSVTEYALIEETISPRALVIVRDWLLSHLH